MRTSSGGLTGRIIAWRVSAAALTLAGVVGLVLWSSHSTTAETRTGASGATSPSAGVTGATEPAVEPSTLSIAASRPVRLTVPRLGLSTRLSRLALQPDDTVEVPANPAVAGWYRLGTVPGAVGSAVILGHVDSVDGPAVFARLSELSPGDRIAVRLDNGSVVRFAVRTITTYPNADFPARRVYTSHGRRELNLITCGGAYDADRGGYQANVVVNARRVWHPAA